MKEIYLLGLRLYDSKDAQFPLDYEQVTNAKKEIFLEFLRFDADEHIAVDLFGDLALPSQIVQILSLAPCNLKIDQSDGLLDNLKLSNIELVQKKLDTKFSSNPILTEKPVFLLSDDGKWQVVESSTGGIVPKQIENPANLPTGVIGYLADFVTFSKAQQAELFGNKVAFVCRDPKDALERRISEKMTQKAVCFLIQLIDFCEG